MTPRTLSIICLVWLAACDPNLTDDQVALVDAPNAVEDDRCFETAAAPTETIIVERLVEVTPAIKNSKGVVTSPAVFRNVSQPQINTVGEGERFEAVCPDLMTPSFVATLQRALITRRAYAGQVTGTYDADTAVAVETFQRGRGIDSKTLAAATARQLGILAVDRSSL